MRARRAWAEILELEIPTAEKRARRAPADELEPGELARTEESSRSESQETFCEGLGARIALAVEWSEGQERLSEE